MRGAACTTPGRGKKSCRHVTQGHRRLLRHGGHDTFLECAPCHPPGFSTCHRGGGCGCGYARHRHRTGIVRAQEGSGNGPGGGFPCEGAGCASGAWENGSDPSGEKSQRAIRGQRCSSRPSHAQRLSHPVRRQTKRTQSPGGYARPIPC